MARPLKFGSQFPSLLLLLVFVFSGGIAIPFAVWFGLVLTPLQKHYIGAYSMTAMDAGTAASFPVAWVYKTGPKRKPELASEADVVSATNTYHPELPMALSPEAQSAGWTSLVLTTSKAGGTELGPLLRDQFFDGESMGRLLLTPFLGLLALAVSGFGLREWLGSQSKHEERHGRRTKGPELVTALRWKRGADNDGIRLRLASKLGALGRSFRIPKRLESSHILLMGDTGSGKSNAIRQILRQVQDRGESAIVYDPAAEFVQEFYNPERGDLILNPLDERSPYWALDSELYEHGAADAIAAALLPEKEHENGFFTDAPRRVLARLLRFRPTVPQLLAWLADPAEIEKRLQGTPQAAYLDPGAGPQRGGVLASLSLIADSLALLPEKDEKRGWFATERWKFLRTRWVFLTSRPSVRERVLPLHSVWLDLLILRMMEPCENPVKPVWFVLDELASLNKLPQLHTAVTENRKYGNPVVLGFQGRSQLEKRYGRDAEAMLSQPATKIFFKTSEPRAAKWISETLGEIEVERLKESRTPGLFRSKKQFAMEIATKPLVMASEIAGLEPLRGFIKQENQVVPVKFALVPLERRQPDFIPRKMIAPEPQIVSLPELPPDMPKVIPPPEVSEVPVLKSALGEAQIPPRLPALPRTALAPPKVEEAPSKLPDPEPPEQLKLLGAELPEAPPYLLVEPAPKKPAQPEPRKSAFRKKQGTTDTPAREWDESRLSD